MMLSKGKKHHLHHRKRTYTFWIALAVLVGIGAGYWAWSSGLYLTVKDEVVDFVTFPGEFWKLSKS